MLRPTPHPQIVRVHCHAQAPAGRVAVNGKCHGVLGDVPGPLAFVGVSARRPDKPDGQVWLQCSRVDCRTWNVFQVTRDG